MKSHGLRKRTGIAVFISLTCLGTGSLFLIADSKPTHGRAVSLAPSPDRIVQYVRDRFGIVPSTKLTLGPFRSSPDAHFEEATITIEDNNQKRDQNILVSRNGHYLIVGTAYALKTGQKDEVGKQVRETFKLAETVPITVSEPRKSSYPDLNEISVTVEQDGKKQPQNFYVSKDNHVLFLGSVFNLGIDPVREALRVITTRNQPSEGPATAPVTIVEFADLQCPTCARLHEFLETDLVPKYGKKVRVVFKEFPLPMHDWSRQAAIANQCAYQIDPSAFVAYRSLIFKNQSQINATNVHDMLLNLATQAGIDSIRLGGCLESKASLPRIDENVHEAEKLEIHSTPTSYINGKMIIGLPTPQSFYEIVEAALHTAK